MIYYVIFITGFTGFLAGLLLSGRQKSKTQNGKECSKSAKACKCEIENAYGGFLSYDGSEKA